MEYSHKDQEKYMRIVLDEAEKAIAHSSNPFAAIFVDMNGKVVARAHNTVTAETDILRHAELNLIKLVNKKYGLQKLNDFAVFINAASCAMCSAAMIQAGVRDFYFGAPFEPHTNPALSYEQIQAFCHEPIRIHQGILLEECQVQIARGRAIQEGAK